MVAEFPSKRDAWLSVVIWSGSAALVAGAGVVLQMAEARALRPALAALDLAAAALGPWLLYGTSYRVDASEIRVVCGPFRWRVPLDAIASVTPSRNPRSSPACSLDRLRVAYRSPRGRRRALLLSPADRAGFLAVLAARCPQLVLAGERLGPREPGSGDLDPGIGSRPAGHAGGER